MEKASAKLVAVEAVPRDGGLGEILYVGTFADGKDDVIRKSHRHYAYATDEGGSWKIPYRFSAGFKAGWVKIVWKEG
jgi:hypothetical protein